mgnify:CR=1 FL=1
MSATRAYLALGSNLGDRIGHLQRAVDLLAATGAISVVALSRVYETAWHGIVPGALFATCTTFAILLLSYQTRIIRVSDRMMRISRIAMFSVVAFSMISLIVHFMGVATPWLWDNSPLGYALSIVVIIVACMMLLTDFASIERGVAVGAPAYMEWYAGWGLLVSVVWLYTEFLRLLARMRQ